MRHHLRHPTRYFTSARILLGCLLAIATAMQISQSHAHDAPSAPVSVAHAAH